MMDEDDEMERLRRWLPGQDPRTWHQVALTWNWDNGTELLDWILDQPQCDRGTAIAIYLAGEPDFYADEFASLDEIRAANHFGLEVAQFLARICERWAEGRFPDYEFHPGFWLDRTKLWDEIPPGMISSKAPWPVPASMAATPLRGEAVDLSSFTEGMPHAWFEPEETQASLVTRLRALLKFSF